MLEHFTITVARQVKIFERGFKKVFSLFPTLHTKILHITTSHDERQADNFCLVQRAGCVEGGILRAARRGVDR